MQPSLRREWELHRDGELAARMRLPLIRRGASVDLGARELKIGRVGGLRSETPSPARSWCASVAARSRWASDPPSGSASAARKATDSSGPEGELLVWVKISGGLLHTNGEAEAGEAVAEQDALVLALLGSYLLIRKAEDEASAAGAASVAATSS